MGKFGNLLGLGEIIKGWGMRSLLGIIVGRCFLLIMIGYGMISIIRIHLGFWLGLISFGIMLRMYGGWSPLIDPKSSIPLFSNIHNSLYWNYKIILIN